MMVSNIKNTGSTLLSVFVRRISGVRQSPYYVLLFLYSNFHTISVLFPWYFHHVLFHSTMCNVFVCVMAVADHVDCLALTTFSRRKARGDRIMMIPAHIARPSLCGPLLIRDYNHATRVWSKGLTLHIFVDVIPNLCGIFAWSHDSWLDFNGSYLEVCHVINNIRRNYKGLQEN